ncbi:hypothetical protein CJ030_MR4G017658 [Morella rubra]|uniref:Uncharacterized protein n=1 Tax=Morella rubra TaxID=262757 RepID=A0A6A1VTU9_9ROSI|nr:hypothetical protein CJ030_MR4G017658 [Morella rubra]
MVQELIEMNASLEESIVKLTKEVDQENVQQKNFSSGTSKLDKMLSIGHSDGDKRRLGFKKNASALTSSKKVVFVPAIQKNPTIPAGLNEFIRSLPEVYQIAKLNLKHLKPNLFRDSHLSSLSRSDFIGRLRSRSEGEGARDEEWMRLGLSPSKVC